MFDHDEEDRTHWYEWAILVVAVCILGVLDWIKKQIRRFRK